MDSPEFREFQSLFVRPWLGVVDQGDAPGARVAVVHQGAPMGPGLMLSSVVKGRCSLARSPHGPAGPMARAYSPGYRPRHPPL